MIPNIQTITREYVDGLIDFAPTEAIRRAGIGELQKDGAVALFNMLVRNGVAYLADEVGMGKTYIGLAVMHLLRYQKPDARVLIITPRRNIQEKWSSDLNSFVQQNWRTADHRVKTPQGSPDWPVLLPDRLSDWVRDVHDKEPHDTVMRMSSFSLGVSDDNVADELRRFKMNLPETICAEMDVVRSDPTQAKFTDTIRSLIAKAAAYDLIIVDEAHNLKHGYRKSEASSIRNESMFHLFGDKPGSVAPSAPWLLLLSATPMENGDPSSLVRQFEVFGRDSATLLPPQGDLGEPVTIRELAESGALGVQRALQQRLIVRRVGELRLQDGSRYTRNMYRQEWRAGGVEAPDIPMHSASPSERLVNAVIQKNVFELLQAWSGGRFRIGALESFEIYSGAASSLTEVDDAAGKIDQALPDQRLIADLCESYRANFAEEVPHPKLNAVAKMLGRNIRQREKSLVFVRRVATTKDLASRASEEFDHVLISLFKSVVQASEHDLVDRIEVVWKRKRASRDYIDAVDVADNNEDAMYREHDASDEEEDDSVSEVVPSLFTWLFRGEHRGLTEFPDIFSGRRMREQLEARSRFTLVLEENYVDWVLRRPANILDKLASDTGMDVAHLIADIARFIPGEHGGSDNFRRAFHGVQYGALSWMAGQSAYAYLHDKLNILLDEVFGLAAAKPDDEQRYDEALINEMLSMQGVNSALARTSVDGSVWRIVPRGAFELTNQNADFDFRTALRRREQIRHVQAALLRNGAPSVDLYLACLTARGGALHVPGASFGLNANEVAQQLAARWQQQAKSAADFRASGAWELLEVNENFDLIKKLNFPALDVLRQVRRPLDAVFISGQEPRSDNDGIRSARRMLNQELAGQAPTAAAKGGQTDERRHRITTHFRMPGMPWVVVATTVYEEGVDLHTFCRTVVHHGISHTASSVEQRTGRVDRIGGLVQRESGNFQGKADFSDDKKIQSLFPYQNDTFEKFQVRRVLANCNRFLEALHETDGVIVEEKEMNISDKQQIPPQITSHLTSPFDVQNSRWLHGVLAEPDHKSDFVVTEYLREIQKVERSISESFPTFSDPGGQGLDRHYRIGETELAILPKSHREGDHLLVEIYIDNEVVGVVDSDASGHGWGDHVFRLINELFSA
jgi:hypothetical protein